MQRMPTAAAAHTHTARDTAENCYDNVQRVHTATHARTDTPARQGSSDGFGKRASKLSARSWWEAMKWPHRGHRLFGVFRCCANVIPRHQQQQLQAACVRCSTERKYDRSRARAHSLMIVSMMRIKGGVNNKQKKAIKPKCFGVVCLF